MHDRYSHDDSDIIYITENIPGPVVLADDTLEYDILLSNFNSQMLDSCTCGKICLKMLCNCLHVSRGDNYERYILEGELNHRLNYKLSIFNEYPIVECNSNCTCDASCGNRVVQNGPLEGLIVKPCEDEGKGLGLFAPDFIRKGTFICEYAGEVLTRSQAILRTEENEVEGRMNYIFCLNERTYEGLTQTFVDSSMFGNIGRYINHSCESNSRIVPVRTEISIPHLAVFAKSDIYPDEEITFNYGSGGTPDFVNNSLDGERKICLCNSEICDGFMPLKNF